MLYKQLFSSKEKILAMVCAVLLIMLVVVGFVLAKNEINENDLSPQIKTSTIK